jgi:sarcosine oxidase
MPRADVVVVGAGVMGAAAAWRLARSGRDVVLLEQFEVGHDHGSSHGSARVFRFSYDEARYVAMAMEALPLWRRLEEDSGQALLTVTGGFDMGSPARLEAHQEALDARGAVWDLVDGAEVARRFPGVAPPADAKILFQPDAGVLAADRALRAMVQVATARGVELRERTRVSAIRPDGAGVEVVTKKGTWDANVAVVTAGAWAKPLLAGAGIDLPVTPSRETVAFFPVEAGTALPVLVEWIEGAGPLYALPSPGEGLKTGWHHSGAPANPDEHGRVETRVVERMSAWVSERFPGGHPKPHHAETCLYTNTADESFILERRGPVVVGSACSGHGFKFAPAVGERLARLATGSFSARSR